MASLIPFPPQQTTSTFENPPPTTCKNPPPTAVRQAAAGAVAAEEASAKTRPRQQLVRAQQLLLSRNLKGARSAYTLALNQSQFLGSFDLAACFLYHLRLAQLNLLQITKTTVDGDPRAAAQGHLESAWALMDRLTPPLAGALGCYFRGVGLKLAGLYDESSENEKAAAVRRRLEKKGLLYVGLATNESEREEGACKGEDASSAAAETAAVVAVPGCGSEAETGIDCDGCGRAITKGGPAVAAAEEGRDRGRGWYCPDCTDAYDKAVAQVKNEFAKRRLVGVLVSFARFQPLCPQGGYPRLSTPSPVPSVVSLGGLSCT